MKLAWRSKIGKLSRELREELNRRLYENAHTGKQLSEWLSKESGTTINEQNISDWRSTGFAEWMDDQRHTEDIRKLSDLAYRIAKAGGDDNVTEAMVKIAAGKILPMLEVIEADNVVDIVEALDRLASKELAARKDRRAQDTLELNQQKEVREQEKLELLKTKFARDTAKLFLKWSENEKAKEIARSGSDEETKIGEMIQLFFGDMPEGIGPKEDA